MVRRHAMGNHDMALMRIHSHVPVKLPSKVNVFHGAAFPHYTCDEARECGNGSRQSGRSENSAAQGPTSDPLLFADYKTAEAVSVPVWCRGRGCVPGKVGPICSNSFHPFHPCNTASPNKVIPHQHAVAST